jgi:hypothetical protein
MLAELQQGTAVGMFAIGLKGPPMDTLLEIGKQVPALAVLAGVVVGTPKQSKIYGKRE